MRLHGLVLMAMKHNYSVQRFPALYNTVYVHVAMGTQMSDLLVGLQGMVPFLVYIRSQQLALKDYRQLLVYPVTVVWKDCVSMPTIVYGTYKCSKSYTEAIERFTCSFVGGKGRLAPLSVWGNRA